MPGSDPETNGDLSADTRPMELYINGELVSKWDE
ncbi:hypothetical protein C3992_03949 [Escherichia coli]|nr:hypothetical protein C3992_03949 [Escherichia coli]